MRSGGDESRYTGAQVCPNGHVSTSNTEYAELLEKFCSRCGEQTLLQCPSCGGAIRGDYLVPGYFSASTYSPPAYCHNCGKPFPWTTHAIDSAVELAESGGTFDAEEIARFRSDVTEATRDSPRATVAASRVKKALAKIGGVVGESVKKIVVDVVSETAKKMILGA